MTISIDQRIEIIKILVGVVLANVGGLWTYSQYTEEVRNQ